MKKNIAIGCLFVCFVTMLASCTSAKPTVTNTTSEVTEIIEIVHDTVFKTQIDSSSYKALIDCINGQAVIKEVIEATPGNHLKAPKVRVIHNTLSVDCEAKAQALFAQWKSQQKKEVIVKTVPVKVNELTFWQQFQIKGFKILSLLFLLILIRYLIKIYSKIGIS